MPTDNFLNTVPLDVKKETIQKKQVVGRKKPKKTKKTKQHTLKANLQDLYSVVSAITNAPSGLIFGHLWKGNAVSAKRELDLTLGRGKLKLGMMEEKVGHCNSEKEERYIAVTLVRVRRVHVHPLLYSNATPNLLSRHLVKLLSLKSERTRKVVTVSNGKNLGVLGKVMDGPVLFEHLEAIINFIVLQDVPFDLVIGRPTLKDLASCYTSDRRRIALVIASNKLSFQCV